MIIHKDISIKQKAISLLVRDQYLQIPLPVLGRPENILFLVAAGDYMIKGTGKFDSGFAYHGRRLAR